MTWKTPSAITDYLPLTMRTGIAVELRLHNETVEQRTSIIGEIDTVYIPATKYLLISFDGVSRENDISLSFVLVADLVPKELLAIRGGFNVYGEDNEEPI